MDLSLREELQRRWPTPFMALQLLHLGQGRIPPRFEFQMGEDDRLGRREVRLMSVEKGSGKAVITCFLRRGSLDVEEKGRGEVQFAALSYAWGHVAKRQLILCNGHLHYVTDNLFGALWQLRESGQTDDILLWVDAVCINQDDRTEKTAQVRLMSDIYRRAHPVFVWLGPGSSSDGDALDLLSSVREMLLSAERTGRLNHMDSFQGVSLESLGLPAISNPSWKALGKIFSSSWFSRVWAIEEFVFAREAKFVLGNRLIDEATLMDTVSYAPVVSTIFSALMPRRTSQTGVLGTLGSAGFSNLPGLKRNVRGGERPFLFHLLDSFQDFEAFDPRDRLFALMEVSHDFDKSLIDYSRTTESVLMDLAILALTCGSSNLAYGPTLDILSQVDRSVGGDELPSWVPNWTKEHQRCPLSFMFPTPAHGRGVDTEISIDCQFGLILHGRIIDRVKTTIDCSEITHVDRDADIEGNLVEIMRRLGREGTGLEAKCSELARRRKRYPTGEPLYEVYWRTLICNSTYHTLTLGSAPSEPERAPSDYRRSFRCWLSLLKYLQIYPEPVSVSQGQMVFVVFQMIVHLASGVWLVKRTLRLGIWQSLRVSSILTFVATQCLFYIVCGVIGIEYDLSPPNQYSIDEDAHHARRFHNIFEKVRGGRNFCDTEKGYLGWVPAETSPGDLICTFDGCRTPFALGTLSPNDGDAHYDYRLQGDAYIHGMMDFEWLAKNEFKKRKIRLV